MTAKTPAIKRAKASKRNRLAPVVNRSLLLSNIPIKSGSSLMISRCRHSEPGRAKAAINADGRSQPDVNICVFRMKLAHNSGRRRNNVDFAILGIGRSRATIRGNVGLIAQLPDVGSVAAIHLECACRGPKTSDKSVDVLTDVLLAQPSSSLLPRRGTTAQCSAQRQDCQNTHLGIPPSEPHPIATSGRAQGRRPPQ
jgi:hypothetical protein